MFTLTIETDNAAFGEPGNFEHGEVARLLHKVAHTVAAGFTEGSIIDLNGNTVGHFNLEED